MRNFRVPQLAAYMYDNSFTDCMYFYAQVLQYTIMYDVLEHKNLFTIILNMVHILYKTEY